LVPDLSDVEVAVTGSRFQQVAFGIDADTSRQSTSAEGQAIGCDLAVPPGATANLADEPGLNLPANTAGAAVVLLDSVDIRLTHNRCA
jgi:hypothetical protein